MWGNAFCVLLVELDSVLPADPAAHSSAPGA